MYYQFNANGVTGTDICSWETNYLGIQNTLPFLVNEGVDKDKIFSVDYISIIPILTKGIQELQIQNETQQKQINEMKLLIEKLLADKK